MEDHNQRQEEKTTPNFRGIWLISASHWTDMKFGELLLYMKNLPYPCVNAPGWPALLRAPNR